MNVLFYTPVNFRCRELESLAKKFQHEGHKVFLLSQSAEGPMHEFFKRMGISTETAAAKSKRNFFKLVEQTFLLRRFCSHNKIDVLFSHLEPTNFVSVLIQPFISARVIIFRHHVDVAALLGFDKSLTYRLTYALAKHIIAVSKKAKQYMIEHEGIQADKITHIDLGYDFSLYERRDEGMITEIKTKYPAALLLITAGSLTSFKRPEISIELTRLLRDSGIDVKLLLLGEGPSYSKLKSLVESYNLQQNVFFEGYVDQIMHYLHAADWLIHPSISEASSVVVKEASLAGLPVMVCRGVGDFHEYLNDSYNAIVLDRYEFPQQAKEHILRFMSDKTLYVKLGEKLKQDIQRRFSIENTFPEYEKLV